MPPLAGSGGLPGGLPVAGRRAPGDGDRPGGRHAHPEGGLYGPVPPAAIAAIGCCDGCCNRRRGMLVCHLYVEQVEPWGAGDGVVIFIMRCNENKFSGSLFFIIG
jgi:hypothetical protein